MSRSVVALACLINADGGEVEVRQFRGVMNEGSIPLPQQSETLRSGGANLFFFLGGSAIFSQQSGEPFLLQGGDGLGSLGSGSVLLSGTQYRTVQPGPPAPFLLEDQDPFRDRPPARNNQHVRRHPPPHQPQGLVLHRAEHRHGSVRARPRPHQRTRSCPRR